MNNDFIILSIRCIQQFLTVIKWMVMEGNNPIINLLNLYQVLLHFRLQPY